MSAIFNSLSRCPVCGAALHDDAPTPSGFPRREFTCGAVFILTEVSGVDAVDPCPSPSHVAADALDRQIYGPVGAK